MHLKLPALPVYCGLFLSTAYLLTPVAASAQTLCRGRADSALHKGWQAYRSDSIQQALELFGQAHKLCPENLDAAVGLGFANLRRDALVQADSWFTWTLARSPTNSDAWEGRARTALRLADTLAALEAGRRALVLAPTNADLRALLFRIDPEWERRQPRRAARPTSQELVARTRGREFEVLTNGVWQPFYVRGVNLGAALPGRYSAEFPTDSAQYASWLDSLSAMHANTLRVYTILPPAFYRALRGFNLSHPGRVLWLLHGVWTELPPRNDFNELIWRREFQNEIKRVVDVVHGAARIPPRAGHAAGRYDADVSGWVLGYIIGREWEPYAVTAFNSNRPEGGFVGRFLQVGQAPAMDLWLAQQCDLMLAYESDVYNALRPIAYTNWPTLDPLHHPTEATTAEELLWRRRSGRGWESKQLEYENDAVGLDANRISPTPGNLAGWFASYHVYPYYPDFMMLDPGYRQVRSSSGPSSYFGYLQALIAHHGSMPTLIAEYGVPSSRGIAHLHPQGWNHGGHDEQAMAAIDSRLTREIREAGAAGSVLFAWLDEWFKRNWAVMDYEIPGDHTRLWHNVMDPEQHYGIIGLYAGSERTTPQLGGDTYRWRALNRVQIHDAVHARAPRALWAGADESFLYIAVEIGAAGKFPWDSLGIQIAIDTYHPAIGQHRLPGSLVSSEIGFEFLVDVPGPAGAQLKVVPDYNRHESGLDSVTGDDYGRFSRRPVVTRNRQDGRFDSLYIITNRGRFGRDGTFYPARGYDRGRLRYGSQTQSTLADWFFDERAGLFELRIPWDLLNVTDPSSRTLLHDDKTSGPFGTTRAGDFHFGVLIYRKGRPVQVVAALPALVEDRWSAGGFRPWRWAGWTQPRWFGRLKPVYDSLKQLWQEAPDGVPARPSRTAPSN